MDIVQEGGKFTCSIKRSELLHKIESQREKKLGFYFLFHRLDCGTFREKKLICTMTHAPR